MAKLPTISGKQFVKFFEKQGFHQDRQTGSHIILEKDGIDRPLVIPNHKELSINVVKNNLKTAGINKADFIRALQKPKKSAPAE